MDYSGRSRPVRPLVPSDDHNHPVEAHPFFNESRYVHLVDGAQRLGGWFRLGQRANEGHAETTACLYLPDGRVGFHFDRPRQMDPARPQAGALRFEIDEPFERRRLIYEGELHVLPDGALLEDPRSAFRTYPARPCRIELELEALAPPHGGELLGEDGQPYDEGEGRYFARAHYDQSLRGRGRIVVGHEEWRLRGYGLLDHSWGPRVWQAIPWYRWFPCTFDNDFSLCALVARQADGTSVETGFVYERGRGITHITGISLDSRYDSKSHTTRFRLRFADGHGRSFELDGGTVAAVPCRHVRRLADGRVDRTRILESLTQYRCGGRIGWGLAEYADHVDASGRFEGIAEGW